MSQEFEAVIGLEIHAELQTQSKMFCACTVVDSTQAEPNLAVCPVCAGMPGMLPVLNQRAVEFGLRVALALECEIQLTSVFARKNYFYPDLPKGYQISQYDLPLARNGRLLVTTSQGQRAIRIRRVHLEEDTGKLTHVPAQAGSKAHSLLDLNRAGVPLLEIVSEPDLRTPEEVRLYAQQLRAILRYLAVNSGDMQKGVLRIEPNISVRPLGSPVFGTRTEIKNLNSFRALERSTAYEIERQSGLLQRGQPVIQQTMGWDERLGVTIPQRSKEEAEDYRYFPEPDLPPLVLDQAWVEQVRLGLPELPQARQLRFEQQYALNTSEAAILVVERAVADYFEQAVAADSSLPARTVFIWLTGELFSLLNAAGIEITGTRLTPQAFAGLLQLLQRGEINATTAKSILAEMFETGASAAQIVDRDNLRQISDQHAITDLVQRVLQANPEQVQAYLAGKEQLQRWLFGQVMRQAGGQANPQQVQEILQRQLEAYRS